MESKNPKISVIIPAYNEEKRLKRTLAEVILFFSTKPFMAEIIVVDDGSTDQTAKLVTQATEDQGLKKFENINIKLVQHTKNQGKGGAIKKREDTHRMADANKAFSHYRW